MRNKRLWKVLGALVLTVVLAGCSGSQVTQAQAVEIALEHAGVSQEDALSLSVKDDQEGGAPVYDIQFTTQEKSYHYDVSKSSGEVVSYSYDGAGSTQEQAGSSSQAPQPESSQEESASQSAPAAQGITEEEAQAIALEHAGVSQDQATIHKVKLDRENGRAVFDVEFYVGTTEYDYEIAQDTGEVLQADQDIEDWAPPTQENQTGGQTGDTITMEQAIQLVLDRIPGATANDVRIEEDHDDGRVIYEGEVLYNQAEYEFEITTNGNFIEWSVDYQD